MKILISSDEHWHNFKEFDRLNEKGESLRLSLFEKTFDYISDYCVNNNIKYWLHGGDFFQSRENIPVEVLSSLGRTLTRTLEKGIVHYFLKGNHDMWNRSGSVSSIEILSRFGSVLMKPEIRTLEQDGEQIKVNFCPWDDKLDFRDYVNGSPFCEIVLTHRTFAGAKVHGNEIREGETCEFIDRNNYDVIFSGHIHEHQRITDKAYYIGNLLAHSFKDKNTKKGFLVYETKEKKFDFVVNPYSPEFIQYTVTGQEDQDKLKTLLEQDLLGTRFFDIRYQVKHLYEKFNFEIPKNDNVRVVFSKELNTETRLDKANLLTPEALLEKFAELQKIDKPTLDEGLVLLKEAAIL